MDPKLSAASFALPPICHILPALIGNMAIDNAWLSIGEIFLMYIGSGAGSSAPDLPQPLSSFPTSRVCITIVFVNSSTAELISLQFNPHAPPRQ